MGISISGHIEKGAPLFPSITSNNPGLVFALFEAVIDKFYLSWTNIQSLQQSLPQEFRGRISQRGTAYVFKGPVLITPNNTSAIYLKITMAALLGIGTGAAFFKLLETFVIDSNKPGSTDSSKGSWKESAKLFFARVKLPNRQQSGSTQSSSKKIIGVIATISGLAIAGLAYASLNRVIPNQPGIHFFNWSDFFKLSK